MDHTLIKEELEQLKAEFALQVEVLSCPEQQFPDPGAALSAIAMLIKSGAASPGILGPRRCERCGSWHARRVER